MCCRPMRFGFNDLHYGHARSHEVTSFLAKNILQKIDNATHVMSLCSARQYASADAHFNHRRIQIGQNFGIGGGQILKKVPRFLNTHRISLSYSITSKIKQTFLNKNSLLSCYIEKYVNFMSFSGALGMLWGTCPLCPHGSAYDKRASERSERCEFFRGLVEKIWVLATGHDTTRSDAYWFQHQVYFLSRSMFI